MPSNTYFSDESSFRRKDGTDFPVNITGGFVTRNDPAAGFVWAIEDISSHEYAEGEIHKLAIATDQCPATMMITDSEEAIEEESVVVKI